MTEPGTPTTMTKDEAIQKLHHAKLYAILDTGCSDPKDWPRLARQLIHGGVGALQIRAKQAANTEIETWASQILAISAPAGIPLIINDHPEIAANLGANGCHIGQDDASISQARKIAGDAIFIGKSTHSLAQALAAQEEGADYIGFGPVFATPTKPDYQPIGPQDIRQMSKQTRIPHFCIGGIKKENIDLLKAQGASRVAIVSGLLQSQDPATYAREICRALT
jgi:thiamine-phosphate pyrophosphorylase